MDGGLNLFTKVQQRANHVIRTPGNIDIMLVAVDPNIKRAKQWEFFYNLHIYKNKI
jgi:hypothetical protein